VLACSARAGKLRVPPNLLVTILQNCSLIAWQESERMPCVVESRTSHYRKIIDSWYADNRWRA